MKNIVIIGAGYGADTAKTLEKFDLAGKYRIVMIERFDAAYHSVASLRAGVVPGIEDKIFGNLDNFFPRDSPHRVLLRTTAVKVGKGDVTISPADSEFGESVPYEYLVMATGSNYTMPTRLSKSQTSTVSMLKQMQADVRKAKHVVVVGAGPTGIEMVGEVTALYPNTKVTLVNRTSRMFPTYGISLHNAIMSLLTAAHVHIMFNESIVNDEGLRTGPYKGTLQLKSGAKLTPDYVFLATGQSANSELLAKLDSNVLATDGSNKVKVRPTMQVLGHDQIYAFGDVATGLGARMAYVAGIEAILVAKNIQAAIQGKPLALNKQPFALILITFGPENGIMYLPFFGGFTLGAWIAKRVKSKTMMVSQFQARYLTATA